MDKTAIKSISATKNRREYCQKLIYEDNGVGIAEEHKKDLFKETNCAGMGHGLYLVARICETYGWNIA